jgi:hypothetical protein
MLSNMVMNTEGNNKMIKKLSILVAALAMMLMMAAPAMALEEDHTSGFTGNTKCIFQDDNSLVGYPAYEYVSWHQDENGEWQKFVSWDTYGGRYKTCANWEKLSGYLSA